MSALYKFDNDFKNVKLLFYDVEKFETESIESDTSTPLISVT